MTARLCASHAGLATSLLPPRRYAQNLGAGMPAIPQNVDEATRDTSRALTLCKRWDAISEPGCSINEQLFHDFDRRNNRRRSVLNCAIPLSRAAKLTDFRMPDGWDLDRCIQSSVGFGGPGGGIPVGLETWSYSPQIRPVRQLSPLQPLPGGPQSLVRIPTHFGQRSDFSRTVIRFNPDTDPI
jgi:hypothetical protein